MREDRSTRKAKLVTGLQVQPSNDLGTSRQLLTRESNRPWAKALAENSVPLPGRKTVDLTLNHVSASVVSVAGSFNDWDPSRDALPQRGSGKWSIQLELEPGRYEYLFVADGYWLPDPLAANRVENPHGGHNSVLRL